MAWKVPPCFLLLASRDVVKGVEGPLPFAPGHPKDNTFPARPVTALEKLQAALATVPMFGLGARVHQALRPPNLAEQANYLVYRLDSTGLGPTTLGEGWGLPDDRVYTLAALLPDENDLPKAERELKAALSTMSDLLDIRDALIPDDPPYYVREIQVRVYEGG